VRNAWLIAWKEVQTYFGTPMAYIVGAFFLVLTGYFFVSSLSVPFPEASARGFLGPSAVMLVLWGPLITMRLFAEEQKLGTLELLLTAPVRDWEVVAGKYLASLVMLAGTSALTLYYVLLLFWFGDPDPGPLLSGYLGFLLYGASTLAVGLFASSLTSNQIVSAVVAVAVLLFLTLAQQASTIVAGLPSRILEGLSLTTHYADFIQGVVDSTGVLYFLSLSALFLFLTVLNLESRRWR